MDTSHREKPHPTERTYVKVAFFLAVITAMEIAISYMNIAAGITIAALLVLSLVKFTGVVAYFMHLKFDHPALRRPFVTGLILAGAVYTIVLVNMALHSTGSGGA